MTDDNNDNNNDNNKQRVKKPKADESEASQLDTAAPVDKENHISLGQSLLRMFLNKPLKKLYRLGLLGMIALIVNNTSNVNISELLTEILKRHVCQNYTYTQV